MRGDIDNPIVQITSLTKRYGNLTAVKELSFEVKKGEIFGFLGPNGAGKTTAINMMCGLIRPDAGEILINGLSVRSNFRQVKQTIGVCPQDIVIWEMLTCIEQLEFAGEIYGLSRKKANERGLRLLRDLGLYEKKDKTARTLSGGMQRRLNFALALVHDPEILILDEPQAGLDPQSRILVREYIRSLTSRTTIILTTHDMDEVERLAGRVAIIDQGQLLVMGTPDQLKNRLGFGEVLEIRVNDDESGKIDHFLASLPSKIEQKKYKQGVISIICNGVYEVLPEILQALTARGIAVKDLRIRDKSLEDVFVSLTGRGLRE